MYLPMSCSRNFKFYLRVTFSFKFAWRNSQPMCSLGTSISTSIMLKPTFSFRIHTYHLKATAHQVYRNTAQWLLRYSPALARKTTTHVQQSGPILSLLFGSRLFKRSCCSLGQSLTSKQKTAQQKSPLPRLGL